MQLLNNLATKALIAAILHLIAINSCHSKHIFEFINYAGINAEYTNKLNLYTTGGRQETDTTSYLNPSLITGIDLSRNEMLGVKLSLNPQTELKYYPEADNKQNYTEVTYYGSSAILDYHYKFEYNNLNCYATAGIGAEKKIIKDIRQFQGNNEGGGDDQQEEGEGGGGENSAENSASKGTDLMKNKDFNNFSLKWQLGAGILHEVRPGIMLDLGYRYKKHHNLLLSNSGEELEEPLSTLNSAAPYEHILHFGIIFTFHQP
jgi:opacity protein-like surface antigen